MSDLHSDYPLNHRVFSGGRYLRAFDHLHDIDHYEHSILTYLGSLMPFDKGFVDLPAFPSVATIARSTKISESTVRKKIKELQTKGYLKVKAMRLMNFQGRFQQSSNNYLISKQAFSFFDDVLGSNYQIHQMRKRAVGESYPYVQEQPSSAPLPVGSYSSETHIPSEPMPNSLPKVPKENPDQPDSFSTERDIFTMKSEVDRIVKAWEEVVGRSVAKMEKDSFLREFIRMQSHEIFFMERLLKLMSDPYLMSRAKSINFLFNGFDAAEKNRREIKQIASRALDRVETPTQLNEVLQQLPELITLKSHNYTQPSQQIIQSLLQDPIDSACQRLRIAKPRRLPKNEAELKAEIERLLHSELPEKVKDRLRTIQIAASRCSFSKSLDLFVRHFHE